MLPTCSAKVVPINQSVIEALLDDIDAMMNFNQKGKMLRRDCQLVESGITKGLKSTWYSKR
jgi:hypothetical protein